MTNSVKIIAFVLLFFPITVFAVPGIPHQFYGNVTFDNGAAADGLSVQAKVGESVVGSSVTKNGKYGVNPYLLLATKADGDWNVETVKFFVSGIDTSESFALEKGKYTNLDLSVPGSVGVITKSAEETITNMTVAVAPTSSSNIKMGESLNITISASSATSANIEKIEKLSSSFFTGAAAVISGKNMLNAYEIKIVGTGISIGVTMSYSDSGIDESTIKPYRFDGTNWVEIIPFTINTTANTLTFNISSAATPYSLFGSTAITQSNTNTSGGGGGGGGSYTPAVTTISPLSAEAQKVDTNKDGKIDLLDFNKLMIDWDSTGSGIASDFDGNGTVDILDFNLLMINWTS